MKEINKKLFVESLPTKKVGTKVYYDWNEAIGKNAKFLYGDTEYELLITNYDAKKNKIEVEYNNRRYWTHKTEFLKGRIGRIIGAISSDYKFNIGDNIKDQKRNITIIDKYKIHKNQKYKRIYKYVCNKCQNIDVIEEHNLLNGKQGCNLCGHKKVIEDVNSIYAVAPFAIDWGISIEDAKKYTPMSNKKINITCPICGKTKNKAIFRIFKNNGVVCECQKDGLPFTEKYMISFLKNLKVNYIYQLNSSHFDWCGKYRYDFYFKFNGIEYIIEIHGMQHYEKGFSSMGGKTLQEEIENDLLKKELAFKNGFNDYTYIVLDFRYSNLDWFINSIMNSLLPQILDFKYEDIDWEQHSKFAISSILYEICDYKNNNPAMTSLEIANIYKLNRTTIIKYLKLGNKLNLCSYDARKEIEKSYFKKGMQLFNCKKVAILKDEIELGVFNSITSLEKESQNLYGVILKAPSIGKVANGKAESYKGYTFKFV